MFSEGKREAVNFLVHLPWTNKHMDKSLSEVIQHGEGRPKQCRVRKRGGRGGRWEMGEEEKKRIYIGESLNSLFS